MSMIEPSSSEILMQFQTKLQIMVDDQSLTTTEKRIITHLHHFFRYPKLTNDGEEFRWETLHRLCERAFGCRERWLQGELSLEGFGVDDISDCSATGKFDFSYPAQMNPIVPRTAVRNANEVENTRFPQGIVELIGELKIWAGGVFKEPEGVRDLLHSLDQGDPLGSARPQRVTGEERWGLVSDYHRLRMVNIPGSPNVLRLLILVIDRNACTSSSLWGQFVCHPKLNFIDAISLPDLLAEKKLWVRTWKILPNKATA